jgi:hypothetical protein
LPVHKIQVHEYECAICGCKWIRHRSGKDLGRPKKCSRCKRVDWDEGPMSIREKYLRNRLIQLEGVVAGNPLRGRHRKQPNELCKKFLWEIEPRPTTEELEKVNYPLDIDIHLHVGYVPFHYDDAFFSRFLVDPESREFYAGLVKRYWNSESGRYPDMDGWKRMCEEEGL